MNNEPEKKEIETAKLAQIKLALETALEYQQEALIRHDEDLGRTLMRNKRLADMMEQDIERTKDCIRMLIF